MAFVALRQICESNERGEKTEAWHSTGSIQGSGKFGGGAGGTAIVSFVYLNTENDVLQFCLWG